jgi:branched-chain amino acid transport system ATP-binding protein
MSLELRGLQKSFGNSHIIRGVDLAVQKGERVALIGPNGAGKSTLIDLITGRTAPGGGDVLLNGQSIAGMEPYQINRLGLSRSFQTTQIFPKLSVFENLRCGLLWRSGCRYNFWQSVRGLANVNRQTEVLLQRIGLETLSDVLAGRLTYAQQRALEIGITLAGGAQVLVLDEPTAGMNRSEAALFVELIRTVTEGKTLLLVEHDMGVVFELADRIAVLVQGKVIAFDTVDSIRANPLVQQAYLGSAIPETNA